MNLQLLSSHRAHKAVQSQIDDTSQLLNNAMIASKVFPACNPPSENPSPARNTILSKAIIQVPQQLQQQCPHQSHIPLLDTWLGQHPD